MAPDELINAADEALSAHTKSGLTDVQRLILHGSLAGKSYEEMEGYAPQHLKNEGTKLWRLLSEALGERVSKTNFRGALEKRLRTRKSELQRPVHSSTTSINLLETKHPLKIFLAHASEDKARVRKIYTKLSVSGFKPWLDEIDLLPGQNWQIEIPRAIQESDIFIACLSHNSVQKKGYVQREFRLALDACAEKPVDDIYLIPLKLDDCEIPDLQLPKLGIGLRDYQWLEFWKPDGFNRLIRAIETKQSSMNPGIESIAILEQTESQQIHQFPAVAVQQLTLNIFDFEVVTVDSQGKEIRRDRQQAQCFSESLGNGIVLEMILVPGGTFLMGSPQGEPEWLETEGPKHRVMIPPFCMGKFPVTQAQWEAVAQLPKINVEMEPELANFKGASRPIECVSWNDAQEFCARLSHQLRKSYRLPSEAEWEYACRAETTTPFSFGATITTDLANYDGIGRVINRVPRQGFYGQGPQGIYREETTEVGFFNVANMFGLYDMHGNVWEWCQDTWQVDYNGAPSDGSPWVDEARTEIRVIRGGSRTRPPIDCRSTSRYGCLSTNRFGDIGFRVALSLA